MPQRRTAFPSNSSLRFSGRTPSRFTSTQRTFPGRAWGLKAFLAGLTLVLLGELVLRRHGLGAGWLFTGTGKWAVDLHREAWLLPFRGLVGLVAGTFAAVGAWWGLARYRHWRRPSVPFTILLVLQLLAALTLWPKVGRSGAALDRPLFPEEWALRAGIILVLGGAMVAWGSAPGKQLMDFTGASRSAVGFLKGSQLPQRIVGVTIMVGAGSGILWAISPILFHPTHPTPGWPPEGLSLASRFGIGLGLTAVYLVGRGIWRKTWRAFETVAN